MTLVARTQSDPAGMSQAVKQQIWKVDSQLPLTKVQTLDEVAAASFAARRFNMLLLAIFAGLALVLAAVGIYGVMSYAVTQRTQEIGIRMALGAQASDVLKLIVRNGMALTLVGVAIGLAGAFALTRSDDDSALRSDSYRCRYIHDGFGCLDRRRVARLLSAGATCDKGRSTGGVALRVKAF